ncbi:4937_t:CDS:2, partial [Racocetra persica]
SAILNFDLSVVGVCNVVVSWYFCLAFVIGVIHFGISFVTGVVVLDFNLCVVGVCHVVVSWYFCLAFVVGIVHFSILFVTAVV